ncbi:inter-alpha-trypsin inhibitor heavy chain H3-like [Mya arenaria]|uniref:inter-alpha-trypsin inhibitor heavy chain H3-like n=1 Tax=Mya arenaria TaxID=6604 RepID=UPI0022E56E63|nr:inter-alpha-trypsin inhibitor heavy chain H3-like [Mya arenaria]
MDNQAVVIRELTVNSKTAFRFANVTITCEMENTLSSTEQATFDVRIPKSAFITSFVINLSNRTIVAEIEANEDASKIFSDAVSKGSTAGLVSQQSLSDEFDRDAFNIEISLAARSTVIFVLQYQEAIEKRAHKYIQRLFIDTDKAVSNLVVTNEVQEREGFKTFNYQPPTKNAILTPVSNTLSVHGVHTKKISWRPEAGQDLSGFSKTFLIEYELDQKNEGGNVYITDGGEFAHMFSTTCEETKIMGKKIMFVIDVSGSMDGNPIAQVRSAMIDIVNRLRTYDFFNIILFSSRNAMWKPSFVQATDNSKAEAKRHLSNKLRAAGGTNINSALEAAIEEFESETEPSVEENYGQTIFLLTDGSATDGVTGTDDILANVHKHNKEDGKCCKTTILSIAFGQMADVYFLRRLANENNGSFVRINEIANECSRNAILFSYESIANPSYKNLKFEFLIKGNGDTKVPFENLTQTSFLQYDCGSELIVGGWTKPGSIIIPRVDALGMTDRVAFTAVPSILTTGIDAAFIQRLVQYKKLKELIQKYEALPNDSRVKNEAERFLVKVSKEQNFVTQFTSLVVTDIREPLPSNGIQTGKIGGNQAIKRNKMAADLSIGTLTTLNYDYIDYVHDMAEQGYSSATPTYTSPLVVCAVLIISAFGSF